MAGNEAIIRWLRRRGPGWAEFDAVLTRHRRGGDASLEELRTLLQGYQSLGHDLGVVRAELPDSRLPEALAALHAETHALISRPARGGLRALIGLYLDAVPASFQRLRPAFAISAALFLLATLTGWLLVTAHPEMAALFASPAMIDGVQRGELWTDRLITLFPGSVLSAQLILNNVLVCLTSFALGALFGLGTLYILALNGMMLGSLFAFCHQHGLAGRLFEFVIAHGLVEITVLVLAAAAGLALGEALAHPRQQSRRAAFQWAVSEGARLFALLIPALWVCGLIEGYVSTNDSYALPHRMVIGFAWLLLFWIALTGRVRPTPPAEERDHVPDEP